MQGQNTKAPVSPDNGTAIWKEIEPFFVSPIEYKDKFGSYRSPLKFYDGTFANPVIKRTGFFVFGVLRKA
jgi:hypothetical protein